MQTSGGGAKIKKKVLVVYATKCGSTGEVAQAIGKVLREDGTMVEVCRARDVTESSSYDAVIVGSPILYGKWRSEAMRFVEGHKETLRRIPVAYFLTCLELTRMPDEMMTEVATYLDPALGTPPKKEGKLTFFEKGHLLSAFLIPALKRFPQIKPVSVGVFRGKLDYSKLDPISWLVMKLIWLVYKRAPEGDFRNWEAIRSWTASLRPALLPTSEKANK